MVQLDDDSEPSVSSYQKGINRLLEHKANFERLIIEYLLSVNSKYNSNMFPTPQIAKILLGKLKMKKTQFPIIHKIVRTIIEDWCTHNHCDYVTTTKAGRNRRTKFIYKFTPDQIELMKGRFISSSINEIESEILSGNEDAVSDAMKSRERIVETWVEKVRDVVEDIDVSEADPDDVVEDVEGSEE